MRNGIRWRGKAVLASIACLCTNMVNNVHKLSRHTSPGCRESSKTILTVKKSRKHFRMIHVTFPWLFIFSFRHLRCSRVRWWEIAQWIAIYGTRWTEIRTISKQFFPSGGFFCFRFSFTRIFLRSWLGHMLGRTRRHSTAHMDFIVT